MTEAAGPTGATGATGAAGATEAPGATGTASISLGCNPKCQPGYKCMINNCVLDIKCPQGERFGEGPPSSAKCPKPTDPNKKPAHPLEKWFTKDVFDDLFPKANIGWGPSPCWPYSYEAFVIASRYFPAFASESPNQDYTPEQNYKRDLAAFFSHAVQETGENDAHLYSIYGERGAEKEKADACFYRGGFFNWFEGGPNSAFFPPNVKGHQPHEGDVCNTGGRYCVQGTEFDYFFPCNTEKADKLFKGCYFGKV